VLDNLVNKAKKTDSAIWKWILGVCIALIVIFAAWMLKRKYDELVRLRAEKSLAEERKKDMELQAKNEQDEKLVKAFEAEAVHLAERVKKREEDILTKEREYVEAKKSIDDAKTWDELENEARGEN